MKTTPLFYRFTLCIACIVIVTYSSDTLSIASEKKLITPPPDVTLTDTYSTFKPDKFSSFSVVQKKCLRRVIFTNALFAAGYGLYRGVLVPRSKEIGGDMEESLKLMPLSLLSSAMIYVSLPMSTVASYKARNNYNRYYKEKPRNLTIPLLAGGLAIGLGASGISMWQIVKDIQDNNEYDGSYDKYTDVVNGLMDICLITWGGANIYSLVYVIVLGKKAEKHTQNKQENTFHITPFHYRDANGLMLSCEF